MAPQAAQSPEEGWTLKQVQGDAIVVCPRRPGLEPEAQILLSTDHKQREHWPSPE